MSLVCSRGRLKLRCGHHAGGAPGHLHLVLGRKNSCLAENDLRRYRKVWLVEAGMNQD